MECFEYFNAEINTNAVEISTNKLNMFSIYSIYKSIVNEFERYRAKTDKFKGIISSLEREFFCSFIVVILNVLTFS